MSSIKMALGEKKEKDIYIYEGNGNTIQYSCLGNPMDREAWWSTVHGISRVGHALATEPPLPCTHTHTHTHTHTCVYAKYLQLSLTVCNSTCCGQPGSSAHGILKSRILEWVAVPSSKVFPWTRHQNCIFYVSCTGRWVLYH